MSITTLNTKFKLRRDTAAHWVDSQYGNDPVLADGEPVLAEVNGVYKMKIGDGSSKFSELPYYGNSTTGGAEKFVFTLTNNNDTWTADETIADIVAAKEDGDIVVCSIDLGYGYPFELPCVLGDSFGEGVETVFIAMFSGIGYGDHPENIIILADTTSGSDEWVVQTTPNGECVPHYSSTNNGQMLGVNNGNLSWITPAPISWSSMSGKPFYETIIDPGYDYEIDLDDPNYVSGYLDFGAEVPCKFYRVGDVLTASQLEGATGSLNNGVEIEYGTIQSSHIDEIEENGETIGLFVASEMPFALVINNDNTTLNYSGSSFACSGTFASAGTYLFWIDLSVMEEGASAYNPTLVKADEVGVVQLPDKFYKAPLIVEVTETAENNITTYSANATYSEILAALQAERPVYATFTNSNFGTIIIQAKALISGVINFSTTAYIGNSIYAIKIEINDQDEISTNIITFGRA